MLEHAREVIARRTDHPLLITLFLVAVLFVGLALIAEASGQAVTAAFLVIFAMIFSALGVIGYVVTFTVRIVSQYRENAGTF